MAIQIKSENLSNDISEGLIFFINIFILGLKVFNKLNIVINFREIELYH